MHMFSKEKKFFGGHGIVGAQVSIGTGMGLGHQYSGDGGVCLTYMGDGAVNQGQVSESFNMASLWSLPVLYIIEDNQYAMGTSVHRSSANIDFTLRGKPYNIEGHTVDGMKLFDVHECIAGALDHARSGKGPVLIHVKTYRYRGHSMSDPARYRSKEEVDSMRENHDPIDGLRTYILDKGFVTENNLKIMEKEIKIIAQEAADFSLLSSLPPVEELYTDVLL